MTDRQQPAEATEKAGRSAVWPAAAAVATAAVVFGWAATWTGPDRGSALVDAVYELGTALPWVVMWLAAAAGLGVMARWMLQRWLPLDGVLQLTVGIAMLLMIDAAAGSLGLFHVGGSSISAWVLTIAAIAPGVWVLLRRRHAQIAWRVPAVWLWVAMAPAAAVLLLAACSAPGWLWDSEFGGYDALSYHLQLPKQWLELGRIAPVEHNVYSHLPSWMESASYHLMVLRGDALGAVIACQLLHGAMALVAACSIGRLLRELLGGTAHPYLQGSAPAIALGTPWVIVVGSLAYNEMPTLAMLAATLVIVFQQRGTPIARGAVIGLLCSAAVGAKLTSIGMVVLPVCVALLWVDRRRFLVLAAAALAGVIGLSPWLIRNAVHTGNPVFPFLPEVFGSGHWSGPQFEIWSAGHRSAGSLVQHIGEGFQQLFVYGIGANRDTTGREPWAPQWSILPWLGLAGAVLATTASKLRRPAMIMLAVMAVQILFWLLFTHIKSRFMLPMVVPAACGAVLGLHRIELLLGFDAGPSHRPAMAVLVGLMFLWCLQPLLVYRTQRHDAPSARIGWVGVFSGEDVPNDALDVYAGALPAVMVNRVLPSDAQVLLVGDAAPLYYRNDVTYTTVWDRGPMSVVMAAHPDNSEQWFAELRRRGFTHVLLSPTMLQVWERSGWRDPLLDPSVIAEAAQRHARDVARFPGGDVLYELQLTN